LAFDAVFHLYWATGATWPAADEFALSSAVLGFGASFAPSMVLPLAALLSLAAASALFCAREDGPGWLRRPARLVVAAVTAGASMRAALGVLWMVSALGYTPQPFYALNIALYTPMCLALAWAGFRLLGSGRRPRTVRVATIGGPVLLAIGLLVGSIAYPTASADRAAPTDVIAPAESSYVDSPLARFHYLKLGTGSPVVLLAPGSFSAAGWMPQVRALARDHTVYAVDLPGQGYTELRREDFTYDLAGMTESVDAFLDAADLQDVSLGGNSWSGGWALAYAQAHPERVENLLLLAPSGIDAPDPSSWEMMKLPVIGQLMTRIGSSDVSTVEAAVNGLLEHDDAVSDELVHALAVPATFPDNADATQELQARLDWEPVDDGLSSTRTPTLLLWGDQDSVLPVDRAAIFGERMPDARVETLTGCGHALTIDCPDQVNEAMREFLDGD
ncbi:MAG: alpha/beta fold hydrolase, partial [Actinomycetia bacterium]|nr:alpha/beta fold hydrolase [Actinomycetes bacterium]